MNEERGRPGGGEGGRDLSRHVPRLADPADDDAPAAGEDHAARPCEAFVDGGHQVEHRLRLDAQHFDGPRLKSIVGDSGPDFGCR
jgi:hypothetical protein